MMDKDARIDALEGENARLQEKIFALEAALGADIDPHVALGLTGHEARIVGILVKRGRATKDQIMHALYALQTDGDPPEIKIVDVLICRARVKLKRFGIEIQTLWGQGYAMDAASREKVASMIKGSGA